MPPTDEILEQVLAWQRRPLEPLYPVMYLDRVVVKARDGGHVRNKAAHIAVGVDMDGTGHVLGIWVQATEGAKFWASVCADMANRGIKDVLVAGGTSRRFAVGDCEGLSGFPDTIEATWSNTIVQTCTAHLGAPPAA